MAWRCAATQVLEDQLFATLAEFLIMIKPTDQSPSAMIALLLAGIATLSR
jgi:hypothetical protein